ncbi:MAG: DUF1700 domain-containing protein [Candidatus Izemoplasmatales bacterium]|uniref:DUF1700 domain-containing protein n=1 Tax=Hujiaoplasma nucleasis TaxID=2725268 RepID=A0A7L6N5B2_9MOLU|nr:DUF1700 domain-containing protein [Hujiaoplasma nucleasis]QLY40751.1 DUF1700 domain-containing protein [Hujiaoplasma nucleasis]
MKRKEFINQLRKELKYYKKIDSEEIIYYYDEMIQDAVDEGQDESLFIKNLGSIDQIIKNMIKDENFIEKVKSSNDNSLSTLLNGSIKVISLIFYYLALFILVIISISISISGFALIFQVLVYLIIDSLSTMDQIVLIGAILIGIGLAIIGIGICKNLLKTSKNIKLFFIRKTKSILRKREVTDYE